MNVDTKIRELIGGDKRMYPNLKAEMARKKITQLAIAECLNVTPTTISLKLNGKAKLLLPECMKIKNNFFPDCSLEYLFASDEELVNVDE